MIQIRNSATGSLILEVETLQGADLRGADLQGADLRGADLQDSDLRGADLRGADIRGADLLGADLQDVKWPLDLTPLSKEQEEQNLRLVASLALREGALRMSQVHYCATTHCIAGWAVHALPGGSALEKKYNWWLAGFHLLGSDASKMFYASQEEAKTFLEQYLIYPVAA